MRSPIHRADAAGDERAEGFAHEEADEGVRGVEGAGGLTTEADAEIETVGRNGFDPFDFGFLGAAGVFFVLGGVGFVVRHTGRDAR